MIFGTATAIPTERCPWCNGVGHNAVQCPRVRVIEFYEDGRCKRVEFHDCFLPYDPARVRHDLTPRPQ